MAKLLNVEFQFSFGSPNASPAPRTIAAVKRRVVMAKAGRSGA